MMARDVLDLKLCKYHLISLLLHFPILPFSNLYFRIKGTTGVEIASGLHWYLKYKCNAHVSWDKTGGIQIASVPQPGHLPRLDSKGILIRRPVPWNYYQNVVTSSCKTCTLLGIKIPSCVNGFVMNHSHHIPASGFLFFSRFICLVGMGEMGERD